MDAKQLFDTGDLRGAIDQLNADLKAHPLELQKRIFLFELLCFTGNLQRAQRQLETVAQVSDDGKVQIGIQVYEGILKAEAIRRQLFENESGLPKFLQEPPSYTVFHLKALAELQKQHFDQAEALIRESSALRKNLHGRNGDTEFDDFRDGDDVLAPFLEVFIGADYLWLPLENVVCIEINTPRTLRDLLWIPAEIELREHPRLGVHIPVQYYGSSHHSENSVKLGQMTVWENVGEEINVGKGRRTFLINGDQLSIFEINKILFAPSSSN